MKLITEASVQEVMAYTNRRVFFVSCCYDKWISVYLSHLSHVIYELGASSTALLPKNKRQKKLYPSPIPLPTVLITHCAVNCVLILFSLYCTVQHHEKNIQSQIAGAVYYSAASPLKLSCVVTAVYYC